MTRPFRQRLALFLSVLMTAILLCQGMAQASVAGVALPANGLAPSGMSCHEIKAEGTDKAAFAHPTDCQHLDKASDSSSQLLSVLNHVIPFTAFMLPATADNTGAIHRATLALIPPDPDPPAAIRFHRFRE